MVNDIGGGFDVDSGESFWEGLNLTLSLTWIQAADRRTKCGALWRYKVPVVRAQRALAQAAPSWKVSHYDPDYGEWCAKRDSWTEEVQ